MPLDNTAYTLLLLAIVGPLALIAALIATSHPKKEVCTCGGNCCND